MRPPRITIVEALEDHWLRLTFSDGTVMELDAHPLLDGPVFSAVRSDPQLFRQVEVDPQIGTITWPGELDLDPDVLYGRYEPDPPVAFERRIIRPAHGGTA